MTKLWRIVSVCMTLLVLYGCDSNLHDISVTESKTGSESEQTESAVYNSTELSDDITSESFSNEEVVTSAETGNVTEESNDKMEETGLDSEIDSSTEMSQMQETYQSDRSDVFALLGQIKIGWNLGNSLDAHGTGNTLRSETYWGNPKTTQDMIDEIAKKGFNAIRIPVTYAEHVGGAPEYKIDKEWMDRVQEVVDYAMNAGLFVILDTHHEPDYWLKTDEEHESNAQKELTAIWIQVAERFCDYDEKLIFEGMNEPRLKGSAEEWNGGTASERRMVDTWNQAFVDAVRSTGGNNETRLLIICTYGNNASGNVLKELKIPEDDHIAVAVHMYTPYYFTFDVKEEGYSEWTGKEKASITNTVKQLNANLIQKDVPVIVTEFGAVNKQNSDEVIKWLDDYLGTMNLYGIKCFWWDNNCYDTNGENFGIFNRKTLTWYNEKIADALIRNAER